MLTIFRRHRTACPHKSRRYRVCQCAIWIEGSIGDEKVRHRSLNLTSWEAGEVTEKSYAPWVAARQARLKDVADQSDLSVVAAS